MANLPHALVSEVLRRNPRAVNYDTFGNLYDAGGERCGNDGRLAVAAPDYRERDPRNDRPTGVSEDALPSFLQRKTSSETYFPRANDGLTPPKELQPVPGEVAPLAADAGISSAALQRKMIAQGYAMLFTGGDHPYTSIATTFLGSKIGTTDSYLPLYKNNYNRVLAARVVMDVGGANPGATVNLSLGGETSNQNKIDQLYASGTVNSQWILLAADQMLWINTADTNFTVAGAVFRVLLWDPVSIFPDVAP
jgi:hypothetical protein